MAMLERPPGQGELAHLVHELQVHQVELEQQNQELRETHVLLEESRARYCDLFDFAPVGYFTLDAQGAVLEVNLMGAAILGLPRQMVVGRPLAPMIRLESRSRLRDHLRRCGEGATRVESELAIEPRRGRRPFVQMVSVPERSLHGIRYRTVMIDITETKRTEEALTWLADVSTRLGAVMDEASLLRLVPEVIVPQMADASALFVLDHGGQLREAARTGAAGHPEVERALGCTKARERCARQMQAEMLAEPIGDGAVTASAMFVPIALRGELRGVVELIAMPGRGPYGVFELAWVEQLAQRVAFALDHARIHRANEEALAAAEHARRNAEAANRAKDDFLAVVSHELRTPLTAILGWTRILRTKSAPVTRVAHALETIERNANAQVRLVNDLLDMSRILAGKIQVERVPVDARAAIESAIESAQPACDAKGVVLEVDLANDPPIIEGEPDRVQQIAANLLGNAIKFTPPGGTIRVSLQEEERNLVLRVTDTGIGIETTFLPFVFDRFRQQDSGTTRAHGGLGLGLSIVRHLVHAHGGWIRAESSGVGEGATFVVTFPPAGKHRATMPPLAASSAERPEHALGGLRALVVEDDPDARELIVSVLEGSGAQVVATSSAAEAFEALSRIRPQILVSDIGMAGEDGVEMLRRIRKLPAEAGGRTPALAVTACASAQDRARAVSAGFAGFLVKPLDPRDLIAAVANVAAA